jgi:cell division protein FtsL
MRLLNILVILALVLAASFVYKIKFDSTLQAARVAKLRHELRHERDAIAGLRAEWARLDTPARVEGLAERHLQLKPIAASQFDNFDNLPPRPAAPPPGGDPISVMIETGAPAATGSVPPPGRR